jgi:membrane fusion protein, multidrug efflux system
VRRQAELGQQVKAGEVLAQLDPQDFKLAGDAARAQLAAALTSRDLAVADFKRFKELRDQNFISGAELERRESTLKAAQAQVDQAQAQATGQGNQTSYAVLVADVAGVVTAVDAKPGQVVAAGTQVVQVAQNGPRDVVFSVPEDKVALLKIGAPVHVRMWAGNTEFKSMVREVAASEDPVTRTFTVKVSLQSADVLPLGATVTVVHGPLGAQTFQVIKLPISAFSKSGKATVVWVVDIDTMTVKAQPVQIQTADENDVVVASGLRPGMAVVVAGVHVLTPGQKVTLYKEKMVGAVSASASSAFGNQ